MRKTLIWTHFKPGWHYSVRRSRYFSYSATFVGRSPRFHFLSFFFLLKKTEKYLLAASPKIDPTLISRVPAEFLYYDIRLSLVLKSSVCALPPPIDYFFFWLFCQLAPSWPRPPGSPGGPLGPPGGSRSPMEEPAKP